MTETSTPRLALPLLAAGQAQKEMTHNEALLLLDVLVGGAVSGVGVDVPPQAPQPGQCWIIGASPEREWQEQAYAVAAWTAAGWRFISPRDGMRLWTGVDGGFALFRNREWRLGEVHGKVFVEGSQVVGKRLPPVAEPAGGMVVDGPARAAIVAVLEALRSHGLIASDQL